MFRRSNPQFQMKKMLPKENLQDRLLRSDWPHTRDGRKWKKTSSSLERLVFYAKKLCLLGMTPDQVADMFSDLYWDAFGEFKFMMPEEPKEGEKRKVPYFDEFGIIFQIKVAELSPEELKSDYEFYCNAYVKGKNVWWTNPGGGGAGGPLDNFLGILRLDNNYAFGPTKKQKGWDVSKLAELNAVGVYKKKEAPVSVSKRVTKSKA